MNLDHLPDVECDIREVARFYESREPGLGKRAAQELWRHILSLEVFAGIHSQRRGFYRMTTPKPFRFLIYYRLEDGLARVYGVFDGRRDPTAVSDALARRSSLLD